MQSVVRSLSGFDASALRVYESGSRSRPVWQFAWYAASDEGGRLYRCKVISEGTHCYALTFSAQMCIRDRNGGDPLRQDGMQLAERHAGAVRRLHTAERLRRPPGQKIADELRRGAVIAPPARKAVCSSCRCQYMPPSGDRSGKSAGFSVTSKAAFAFSPSRAWSDMPFVTTPPSSEAAATTYPPGHMQNV